MEHRYVLLAVLLHNVLLTLKNWNIWFTSEVLSIWWLYKYYRKTCFTAKQVKSSFKK